MLLFSPVSFSRLPVCLFFLLSYFSCLPVCIFFLPSRLSFLSLFFLLLSSRLYLFLSSRLSLFFLSSRLSFFSLSIFPSIFFLSSSLPLPFFPSVCFSCLSICHFLYSCFFHSSRRFLFPFHPDCIFLVLSPSLSLFLSVIFYSPVSCFISACLSRCPCLTVFVAI